MPYTFLEFFCGCGGTSRGFARTKRFRALLGNDVKKAALQTFAYNHRADQHPPAVIREDIRTLSVKEILKQMRERGVEDGELDCMIGGPPCQGFSQLRRTEHRKEGEIVKFSGYSQLASDPRNDLVLRYLDLAEALKPKFLVIENVPQMLNHGFDGRLGRLSEIVIKMLESELGYKVKVAVINAADYGVPQLRERAIFIASSIGSPSMPPETHADPNKQHDLKAGRLPWVTVRDAIGDLPKPSMGEDVLGGKGLECYVGSPSAYSKRMRSSDTFPFNHVTRSYQSQVLRVIKEMRPGQTWDSESQRMRTKYARMISALSRDSDLSESAARAELEREGKINPVFYKDYYWSAYTRLAWDAPALTITANANFLGSGRFSHPKELRGITMREAARIQSFDDDFRFITCADRPLDKTRIGVGMDMIGEAVPPALSRAIADHLADQLDDYCGYSKAIEYPSNLITQFSGEAP